MKIKQYQKITLLLTLCTLCFACGFKLKEYQKLDSSLASISVKSPASAAQFSYRLENEMKKRGIMVSETAPTQLTILDYQQSREAASINTSNARQTETRLTNKVTFNLRGENGKMLLEPNTLSRSKEYYNDSRNISGKVSEERLLQQEIDLMLIDLIMRRLESVQNTPKPGTKEETNGTASSTN